MPNLSLQGDSDRLNPKYQMGYSFLLWAGGIFVQFKTKGTQIVKINEVWSEASTGCGRPN